MTNTALVLGASGKTGRRLIPELAARGVQTRAASRRPGVDGVMFDWGRPQTHGAALDGADAVYLITPDFVEDPTPVTGPFLDRARAAGVQRVVLVSSMGVEFPNEGPGSSRDRVEQQVKASGLDWTILRPGGFSQNFSEGFLLPGILQAGMFASAAGDGAVAFVDAADIAAVAAAALTEPGHAGATYDLTGPEAMSFAEAAAVISRACGRTVSHRQVSSEEFASVLHGAGMPADYAALVVGDQESIRAGFGARVSDDVRRVTGRPPIAFADYAASAASAWTHPLAATA